MNDMRMSTNRNTTGHFWPFQSKWIIGLNCHGWGQTPGAWNALKIHETKRHFDAISEEKFSAELFVWAIFTEEFHNWIHCDIRSGGILNHIVPTKLLISLIADKCEFMRTHCSTCGKNLAFCDDWTRHFADFSDEILRFADSTREQFQESFLTFRLKWRRQTPFTLLRTDRRPNDWTAILINRFARHNNTLSTHWLVNVADAISVRIILACCFAV